MFDDNFRSKQGELLAHHANPICIRFLNLYAPHCWRTQQFCYNYCVCQQETQLPSWLLPIFTHRYPTVLETFVFISYVFAKIDGGFRWHDNTSLSSTTCAWTWHTGSERLAVEISVRISWHRSPPLDLGSCHWMYACLFTNDWRPSKHTQDRI